MTTPARPTWAPAKMKPSDDDVEDDTESLLAELEQIKKKKLEKNLPKEQTRREEKLEVEEDERIRGNPLLKRWDDDAVFKNQTRGETVVPKHFINDTSRNDFHRKSLQRYMK